MRLGSLDSGIPVLPKQSPLAGKRNVDVALGRDDSFFFSHPPAPRKRIRQGWTARGPPPRIPASDPGIGSRTRTVSVPGKPDASPLAARCPTKTLSPLGKTLRHPFNLSAPKAARVHSSRRGPCLPDPRAPNGSLPGDTEGDGGLQKSSNSELRSQTLPSQLPGDAEALSGASVSCDSGDKRPRGSAFAPTAPKVPSAERRQDRCSGRAWLARRF